MSKRKTLFFIACVAIAFVVVYGFSRNHMNLIPESDHVPTTKYGAFLAAQHAIYVNDFESANEFIKNFPADEYAPLKNSRMLAEFLDGKIPDNVESLVDEKAPASRLMYDAHLAQNEHWEDLYKRHKSDKSAIYAPFYIWGAVGAGHQAEALKYIENLESNPSWKAFVLGQIYAENGDNERAAGAFANVLPSFMNINDYLYIMSFYTAHDMTDAAEKLRNDFSSAPGGMFMANFDKIPEWSTYSGTKNALAFNLVQNVSHTQIMLYSDLSILMLRFAQIIGPESQFFADALNYYTGQFFANTNGNYAKYFDKIDIESPFALFAQMQMDDSVDSLNNILSKQPLFTPALNKIVALYTGAGDKRAALRVINHAMKNENLSETGRAYLAKRRALVYLLFDDINSAQSDIHDASKVIDIDSEIMSIQTRIWATQSRELETAYDYAMTMVKNNPTDVMAWDTVAVVVSAREGNDAALDILEKIAGSARTCSALFEHLGDAYVKDGKPNLARDAYLRAIELSNDGLSVAPNVKKKLQKLK